MKYIEFQWDETKNHSNQRKHKISFEEAKTVFSDENSRLIHDPEHSDKEERFIILGYSNFNRLLIVCHCYKESNEIIRIISARKAVKDEREGQEGY